MCAAAGAQPIIAMVPEAESDEATAALVACMQTLRGVPIVAEADKPSGCRTDAA